MKCLVWGSKSDSTTCKSDSTLVSPSSSFLQLGLFWIFENSSAGESYENSVKFLRLLLTSLVLSIP